MRHAVLIAAAACALLPATASAADRQATPSNLSAVFAAAAPGDTINLEPGDYGNFSGGAKSGVVTIKPRAGASANMSVNFENAANIKLDGLTIGKLDISGTSHDLTISNSTFTGMATIRTTQMANANILLDRNNHRNINTCDGCYTGRITLPQRNESAPSGVTIQNSLFEGGTADGILNGSNGTKIVNNEFRNITQCSNCEAHVDSLQLFGSKNTVVRGNYFHDDSISIMAPDGGDSELIEHNVFVGSGHQIQLGSHRNTRFVHNTVRGIIVHMDSKRGGTASTGGTLSDNLMVGSSFDLSSGAGCTSCTLSNNLFSNGATARGTNMVVGTPKFVGGAAPTTFQGHALADGSPGKKKATDGTDIGADVSGAAPPAAAAPAPAAAAPKAKRKTKAKKKVVRRGPQWRVAPSKPRVGKRVVLVASKSRKSRGRKCTWDFDGYQKRRGCRLAFRFKSAGNKKITLIVKDRRGHVTKRTKTIKVRPA